MQWINYNANEIKGKYLYKFLSKQHLDLFLKSDCIWFSRADVFGDKLECVTIRDLKGKAIHMETVNRIQRQHLVACFHEATNETVAFWDTYCKKEVDRRVFALRFEINALTQKLTAAEIPIASNQIQKLIHGKVIYKNLLSNKKDVLKLKTVKHISLRKEYAFKYEREYRFIIKTKEEFSKEGVNVCLGSIAQNFKILINPLLENDAYNNLKDYLREKGVYNLFEVTRITRFFKPS